MKTFDEALKLEWISFSCLNINKPTSHKIQSYPGPHLAPTCVQRPGLVPGSFELDVLMNETVEEKKNSPTLLDLNCLLVPSCIH